MHCAEASQFYVQLYKMGYNIVELVDIGGGLGVDYDGTRSSIKREQHELFDTRIRKRLRYRTLVDVCAKNDLAAAQYHHRVGPVADRPSLGTGLRGTGNYVAAGYGTKTQKFR